MSLIQSIDVMQACRKVFSWKQTGTILILAIGLTLTTVMFAVGYGYSVFSIPFTNAEQLVTIGPPIISMGRVAVDDTGIPILDDMPASLFFEFKERKDIFADLAAYRGRRQEVHGRQGFLTTLWQIRSPKENVSFPGFDVTNNYFDVLGVSFPGLHEWKQYSETSYPVPLIVSHGAGIKNFGYDAIGKEFDAVSGKITLFGMLPDGFLSLIASSKNLGFSPLILSRATTDGVTVIARLVPGVTPKLAEQMLSSISVPSNQIADDPAAARIIVNSVQEEILKPARRIVLGAWLMGGLILILCITNVAGIYLMRCSYQLDELELKFAIGANFFDMVRPLFFELIALSGIAAIVAYMMIQSILAIISNMVPVTNMAFGKPASGWIVIIFLLACMIAVIIVSLMPAVIGVLKNYRQGFNRSQLAMFRRHKAARMSLIISQTVIAALLLAISNMAIRSYLELFNKDVGMDSSVFVTSVEYSLKIPDDKRVAIVNETLDALRGGNPDARVAVCTGHLFNDTSAFTSYSFKNMFAPGKNVSVQRMDISPGFVHTIKGKLLAGREFTDKDRRGETVLVNATLVRELGWSPQEAIGQVFQSRNSGQSATIIGVVADFLNGSWENNADPLVFEPITFGSMIGSSVHFITHPDALRRTGNNIEQTIYKFTPETFISRHTAWDNLLAASASGKVLASLIVVIFTIAAIAITVTGIVNTILFTITRRTREIAIHVAMGATYKRVFWIVISDVVKAGILGLLLGSLASWWIGKSAAHFFYNGVQYQGALELMVTAFLMLLIIVAASLIPALRILRIEISRALASK